jgi:hypothetical protein
MLRKRVVSAGSGIVPQHDYDPDSSCAGWIGKKNGLF